MEGETAAAIKGQVRISGSNHCLWCDPARLTLTHAWECVCVTQSHWHPKRQLAGVGSPGLSGCALAPAPVSWRSGVLARRAEDKVREEAVVKRREDIEVAPTFGKGAPKDSVLPGSKDPLCLFGE